MTPVMRRRRAPVIAVSVLALLLASAVATYVPEGGDSIVAQIREGALEAQFTDGIPAEESAEPASAAQEENAEAPETEPVRSGLLPDVRGRTIAAGIVVLAVGFVILRYSKKGE